MFCYSVIFAFLFRFEVRGFVVPWFEILAAGTSTGGQEALEDLQLRGTMHQFFRMPLYSQKERVILFKFDAFDHIVFRTGHDAQALAHIFDRLVVKAVYGA